MHWKGALIASWFKRRCQPGPTQEMVPPHLAAELSVGINMLPVTVFSRPILLSTIFRQLARRTMAVQAQHQTIQAKLAYKTSEQAETLDQGLNV